MRIRTYPDVLRTPGWCHRCMSVHLLPVSPSLSVSVLGDGVRATAGLLVGVRWDDETEETSAVVVTEHGGIQWVEQAHVEAVRLS